MTKNNKITKEILLFLNNNNISFKENCEIANLTTLKIRGTHKLLIEPNSLDSLINLKKFFKTNNFQYKILGAGSNVLITNNCNEIPIIKLGREFRTLSNKGNEFIIGASYPVMTLARKVLDLSFSGLEFSAGIPASIGGASYMNAGAHKSEFSNVITKIFCVNSEGEKVEYSKKELAFSYRKSSIKKDETIYSVGLKLINGDKQTINKEMKDCLDYRKNTQPLNLPSLGSIFTNFKDSNSLIPAGKILEEVGLKAYKHGNISFSNLHANWLVNINKNATAEECIEILEIAKSKVLKEKNIMLKEEIRVW